MNFLDMLVARWHALERRDVMAILLLAVFLAAAAASYVGFTGNGGFGPDWDCTNPGEGDAVCVKKPASSIPAGGG
jgi:hypothetical protein